jgi:hypothetical protein
MFKPLSKISGKPTANSDEALIFLTPTPGQFRLSKAGASLLGVTGGDYIVVTEGRDDAGAVLIALSKANTSTNDKGEVVGEGGSFKLAFQNAKEKTGALNFSAAAAYQALGGSEELSKTYTIGEGSEYEGVTYFPLTFKGEKPKTERKHSTKEEGTTTEEVANTPTPEVEDAFSEVANESTTTVADADQNDW